MTSPYTDIDGARVGGFHVEKYESKQGKKEDDSGSIKITLIAQKDEISTGAFGFSDILAALNTHQEAQEPIVLRVLMPTDRGISSVPDEG